MNLKTTTDRVEIDSSDSFIAFSLPGTYDHYLVHTSHDGTVSTHDNFEVVLAPFEKNGKTEILSSCAVYLNAGFRFDLEASSSNHSSIKEDYIKKALKAKNAIEAGQFEKVILSNVFVSGPIIEDLDIYYARLKKTYLNAFVFMYYTPHRGFWVGASPELLLSCRDKHYSTIALAGTKPNTGIPAGDVEWTQKEIKEQKYIQTFVEERLERLGIPYQKSKLKTVEAGSVFHLSTQYNFNTNTDEADLVSALHPGPAICGFPQDESYRFILDHEGHDRLDYCGFIGLRKFQGGSSYFVNLRSMQVFKNQCEIYVGGGLTAESDPGDEWLETQMKAQTLLSTFENVLA